MSNSTSVQSDLIAETNMTYSLTHNPIYAATSDGHPSTLPTTDIQPYAQDGNHEETDTEEVDTQPTNTVDTASSHASQAASAFTALQSTQPIPTVYPPRRPNIFHTRQKHVRFPVTGLSAVATRTAGPSIQELEEADGFPVADMEEFQKHIKDKMEKKTARFMSMMRENAWKQSRVEDLGEVFAIEDQAGLEFSLHRSRVRQMDI